MNATSTITPPEIDAIVEEFCHKLAPGNTPIYVDVIPRVSAIQDECFFNVGQAVADEGGTIVFGWAIWLWPRVLIEANHHAVWGRPRSRLVDITPKADGEKRILFLPDARQVFDFQTFQRVDNVRQAIADDDDVRGLISFSQQIHALSQQWSDGRLIRMPQAQQAQLLNLKRNCEICKKQILKKFPAQNGAPIL